MKLRICFAVTTTLIVVLTSILTTSCKPQPADPVGHAQRFEIKEVEGLDFFAHVPIAPGWPLPIGAAGTERNYLLLDTATGRTWLLENPAVSSRDGSGVTTSTLIWKSIEFGVREPPYANSTVLPPPSSTSRPIDATINPYTGEADAPAPPSSTSRPIDATATKPANRPKWEFAPVVDDPKPQAGFVPPPPSAIEPVSDPYVTANERDPYFGIAVDGAKESGSAAIGAQPPPTGKPNPFDEPASEARPTQGKVTVHTYSIRSGDTFEKLATELGIKYSDLVAANPDVDPRRLRVGQEIKIPRR